MIPSINRLAELVKDNSQFDQSVRKDGDKKAKLIEEKFSHGTKEPKKKDDCFSLYKILYRFSNRHSGETCHYNF